MENCWYLLEVNMAILRPSNSIPKRTHVHQKTYIWMFITALLIIAPNWKQPKCSSKVIRKMNKLLHTCNTCTIFYTEYEILPPASTSMNLKRNVDKSQRFFLKYILHDFIYMKFKNRQNVSVESEVRIVVALGDGGPKYFWSFGSILWCWCVHFVKIHRVELIRFMHFWYIYFMLQKYFS